MHAYDDPDDDAGREPHGMDDMDDDSAEAVIWQWLVLINPGDEDGALQQFAAFREALADDPEADPVELVAQAIDWRAGFAVAADDLRTLMQALEELCARWNLAIDWGGDVDDDDFFDDLDAPALLGIAYDRLAEAGYTLWLRETEDESWAGWITLTRDGEPMRELATALHINLRLACDAA